MNYDLSGKATSWEETSLVRAKQLSPVIPLWPEFRWGDSTR